METAVNLNIEKVASSLTALEQLKKGNERFINNMRINRNLLQEVNNTKEGQQPYAVIISCMDSRTSPELIFDQGLGDIFSIRIAGNIVTPEIMGSAEYACKAVGAKLILVLGHHGCGAIRGAIENVNLGHLPTVTDIIKFSIFKNSTVEEVTVNHVKMGVKTLETKSPVLKELVEKNELQIVGGVYDIATGAVKFIGEENEN